MRDFAKAFYKSAEWKKTSRAYMLSKNYICERCGGVASICHHRRHLNPVNITDPAITLSWDNLEALCHTCHDIEHLQKNNKTYFSQDGDVERVKDSAQIREFKKASSELTELLSRLT